MNGFKTIVCKICRASYAVGTLHKCIIYTQEDMDKAKMELLGRIITAVAKEDLPLDNEVVKVVYEINDELNSK